jgi:4-amino-4-deoxy-L-arabinose transferase-like glycosyltransferase
MRRGVLFVIALSALMCFVGLGRTAISDSDEAFYAEAAREMLESGDWLTPTFNFDERFQKPILYYWLTAATYAVAGVGPFAARVWSALSGLAIALLVYWVARRWYDEPTGLAAGIVAATTFGSALMARMALPDLPLAALTTAATAFALVAVYDEHRSALPWVLLASAVAALAMLTKGPVGPLLVVLAVGGAIALDRRAALIRPSHLGLAALAFLVIATPWYAAMAARHGMEYLLGFFGGDNLARFSTPRFNAPRPFGYYLPIIALGLAPWTAFTILWIPVLRYALRHPGWGGTIERRLIAWALLPLLFFSVSLGKQPRYILPVLPPLAILLARSITLRLAGAAADRRDDPWLRTAAALAAAYVILLGIVLLRTHPLVDGFAPPWVLRMVAAGTIAAGISALALAARTNLSRLASSTALAACVAMLAFIVTFSPTGPDPVERLAALVREHHHASGIVGTFRVMVRNLVFHTHLATSDLSTEADLDRFVARPERLLLVIARPDRLATESRTGRTLRVLGSVRYFNAVLASPRTLLFPDLSRDVAEVEVVATR